jgi:DtxR family Mn-dependent transcriptional regulator
MEDYLEAVLLLAAPNGVARVRDIARRLGVGMPSVSSALKALSRRGLVNYDPYQFITLTARGRQQAVAISIRHETLRRFFVEVLGMSDDSAQANACRIEHAADSELLARLGRLADMLGDCPLIGDDGPRRGRAAASDCGRCKLQQTESAAKP